MKYVGEITDPVHKCIQITELERELIDAPVFQRLRRIKQLAGAHLVYPSAQHSRFEHSMGAMHVAGLVGDRLFSLNELDDHDLVQQLRAASLLHDIGHGPFSHLSEEVMMLRSNKDHEQIGKEIIRRTEISDILSTHGFSPKQISDLSTGQSNSKFMNEIIAGSLSSDLMDYLPRDSLFTGAEYGRIDYNRIINSFTITDGSSIALQRSSLYSFESMLISRYEMFKAVYFHKTVRAAEVMLLHSILLAFDSIDFLTRNVQTFLALTDDTIIAKLLSARQRPVVRQLVRNYLERKLLKCVYEKFVYKRDKFKELDWKWVEDVRSRIAEIASVDTNHVFVDVSGIASVPLAPNKSEMRSILLMTEKGVIRMPVSSLPIINSISGHLDMLRVYTNHRNRNEIAYAARKIFGDEGLEITDGF